MKKGDTQLLKIMLEISKEIEKEIEAPEYQKKSKLIQAQCDEILKMPLNTLEDVLKAKNASRPIPYSVEKVLLFKALITIEDSLKTKER